MHVDFFWVLPNSKTDIGLRVYVGEGHMRLDFAYSSIAKKLTSLPLSSAVLVFLLQQNPKSVTVNSH
jgi:hypothetical protein